MKLAFSTLGCPAWNIETVAEAVVRYGYDAVEWRVVDGSILSQETPEHTLHRLVTLTREYHLSVAALDTSCQFVQADAAARERTVRDAQVMADSLGLLRRSGVACLLGIDGRSQAVSIDGPENGAASGAALSSSKPRTTEGRSSFGS